MCPYALKLKLLIKYESQQRQNSRENGTKKWASTFLSLVLLVWGDSRWSCINCTLRVQKKRKNSSSLHFRIRCELRMICRAAWPLTLDRASQWWWCLSWQLACGRVCVSWHPPRCCRALPWGLPKWRRGAGRLCSAALAWALFTASSNVGRHRGRQRLQQLGGGSEAEVFLCLSHLCKHGERTAPPAAGVAAQLVVSRNGAVPSQDLHLTEDGFVSMTRLIWKSKDTQSDDVMLKSDDRLETRAGV